MELYFARRHVCHRNQMRRFSCDTLLRCTLNRHFWCCQTFSSHTFPSVVELTGSTCSLWQPTFSTFSRALNFLCCPAALDSCRVSWFGFLWWSDFLRWERNIAEQCTSPGLQHPLFRLQSRCSSRKSFNAELLRRRSNCLLFPLSTLCCVALRLAWKYNFAFRSRILMPPLRFF